MDLTPDPAEPPLPRWAGKADLAAHLGVSTKTVERMVADGQLTRYTVRGVSRYDLNQADALFLANAETHVRAG
jgi:hypothetical protein